jgi:hypothetical protein
MGYGQYFSFGMQNISAVLPFVHMLRPLLTHVVYGWKGIRDRDRDGGSVISFTGRYGQILFSIDMVKGKLDCV